MIYNDNITVLICHRDPLVAAGAAAVLRESGLFEVAQRDRASAGAGSTLMTGGSAVLVADHETGMHSAWAAKTLILSHLDGEAHVRNAIERGVRGYLHLGCTADALRDGIMAVHRGATAYSQSVVARIAESLAHQELTERELSVLRVMMRGLSNKAIGHDLAISVGTVKSHAKAIFRKLRVRSRAEAVVAAHQRGLAGGIEPERLSQTAATTRSRSAAPLRNEGRARGAKPSRMWVRSGARPTPVENREIR